MTLEQLISQQLSEAVERGLERVATNLKPTPTLGPNGKLGYNVKEAAELLPVGQQRLYELCRSNQLECFKVGNQFVIPHRSIEEWLEREVEARKAQLEASLARDLREELSPSSAHAAVLGARKRRA